MLSTNLETQDSLSNFLYALRAPETIRKYPVQNLTLLLDLRTRRAGYH